MRFARKLFVIVLAMGLAGCQTAGPAAQSKAQRTAAQSSAARATAPAAKNNIMMGVGF